MPDFPRLFLLAAIACLIAGCAGQRHDTAAGELLLPMPDEAVIDPDDDVFMAAISEWMKENGAPPQTRYEFTRLDLNGDGRREGLVLLQSPHTVWCMEYGCTMMIFQAHDEGFSVLSEVSPVRGPMTVTDAETNGWKDIFVRVSGRSGWQAKDVALRFDGRSYPSQPALERALPVSTIEPAAGVKIFP